MGNVIDLATSLLDRGEAVFAECESCKEQSCFLPVIRSNRTGPFIASLICVGPYCEGERLFIPVSNGYLQEPDDFETEEL